MTTQQQPCFKCESCQDVYESEGEATACEAEHVGFSDLTIIEVKHSAPDHGSYEYGYPERLRLIIDGKSGSVAEYRLVKQSSCEEFEPFRKAIDEEER